MRLPVLAVALAVASWSVPPLYAAEIADEEIDLNKQMDKETLDPLLEPQDGVVEDVEGAEVRALRNSKLLQKRRQKAQAEREMRRKAEREQDKKEADAQNKYQMIQDQIRLNDSVRDQLNAGNY